MEANPKIKAVVFDVDGTLMEGISWTKLTHDLGASKEEHERIHKAAKTGEMGYEEARKAIITMWRKGTQLKKARVREIFEKWELKKDAVPLFEYLKKKGYVTCLLTGSMDFFAEIVARKTGADFWYANNAMIWDKEGNLLDFNYDPNQAKKKLNQLKEFCAQQGIIPENCVTVGDDSNDIEVFKATGHGICVESPTSMKVEQFAWKKVKHLKEIEGIL